MPLFTLETLTLIVLAANTFFMVRQLSSVQGQYCTSNKKLEELKNEVTSLAFTIEATQRDVKVDILTLQADILKNVKQNVSTRVTSNKTPPSNRKPRTEEQKALASKQRKEWWERRRQEKKPSPDVVTITQPLR